MDSKGFNTIDEMKGAILPKLITFDEAISAYAETKGKIVVSVDEDECSYCGLCEELCNWDALSLDGGNLHIFEDKCEGCGVCVCACPTEAMKLENVGMIREAARG